MSARMLLSMLRVIQEGRDLGFCEFNGCDAPATTLACGGRGIDDEPSLRALPLGFYCGAHAAAAAESGDHLPEYLHTCIACGCLQGVN